MVPLAGLYSLNLKYYWVNGTGNWSQSDGFHWATTSGGTTFHNQAPDITDSVFFDLNSFTSSNQEVTMDIAGFCRIWIGQVPEV